MIILVDMDGVLADFERGFLDKLTSSHPEIKPIPLEQRGTFSLKEQYPPHAKPFIEDIYMSEGFYKDLSPIEGSLEALKKMYDLGHKVYICTSPLLENIYCIPEKYRWITKHLGEDWVRRTIISKDKTLIRGDLLIDDSPVVKGLQEPLWEHILYEQPYNKKITSKRRLTWKNWKEVL